MSVEDDILRVSREFAEACADCEMLRTTEAYPKTEWQAAWTRRLRLTSRWARLAKTLSDRPTEPPESRST